MRALAILFLTPLVLSSCAEDTSLPIRQNSTGSVTQSNFESPILYSNGGGMLGKWNELEVGVEGLATGWVSRDDETRESIGSRQLSNEEMRDLSALLEPLSSYSKYYKPESFMPDGLTSRITTKRDGAEITISVYQPGEADLPPDLASLIQMMDRVFESLR